jgi:hypothetical protein
MRHRSLGAKNLDALFFTKPSQKHNTTAFAFFHKLQLAVILITVLRSQLYR